MICACKDADLYTVNEMIKKKITNWNAAFKVACEKGHIDVMKLILDQVIDFSSMLRLACENGHKEIVQIIIDRRTDVANVKKWLNKGLYGACLGGHEELVNLMIRYGANDWQSGLFAACYGGHLEIVNLMIWCGADNWCYGFSGACAGGHRELINLMFNKGARYHQKYDDDVEHWNQGLVMACENGHTDIVKSLVTYCICILYPKLFDWSPDLTSTCQDANIKKIKEIIVKRDDRNYETFWRALISGLEKSCLAGHIEIADFLSDFKIDFNWSWLLRYTCKGGHQHIFDLIIRKAKNYHFDWNQGLIGACKGGHFDFAKEMINRGASEFGWECLENVCKPGNEELVDLITSFVRDRNLFLANACYCDNVTVINMMVDLGANNWDKALYNACLGGHDHIVQWLLSKDVKGLDECLAIAAQCDHFNIVERLVLCGAKDKNGLVLRGLLNRKNYETAKLYIEHNVCKEKFLQRMIFPNELIHLLNLGMGPKYIKGIRLVSSIRKSHSQRKKKIQDELAKYLCNEVIFKFTNPYISYYNPWGDFSPSGSEFQRQYDYKRSLYV